jgi:hypothetical protein
MDCEREKSLILAAPRSLTRTPRGDFNARHPFVDAVLLRVVITTAVTVNGRVQNVSQPYCKVQSFRGR